MRRAARFALLGLIACGGAAMAEGKPPPLDEGGPPAAGGTLAPPPAALPPPAAEAPPPADEPAAVRTLRSLLGPEVRLGYGAAEVFDPARGAVRLRDVAFERPDRRATIEELTLEGLHEDGVDEADARGVALLVADGATRAQRVRLQALRVSRPPAGQELTPLMLGIGALRIEGLSAEGETPTAIATLSVEEYGAGRPSRLEIEGLEVLQAGSGPGDRLSLGRLTLKGLDLAASLAALMAKEAPPRPAGSWALEAEDLSLASDGRPVGGLSALRLGGEAAPEGGGPETGRLALREIRVEPFPGLAEWLRRFGYPALLADLTAETRYDRAAGRLEVTSLSLAGRDIGAITLSLAMDGATPEALEAQDTDRLRLLSFGLRYLDQSLYPRFVRQQAQQTRRTEQQVREELAREAAAALTAAGDQAEAAGALAPLRAAVERFLRGEAREVEITARPPAPLPLSALADGAMGGPAELQRMLGLGAAAR